MERSGGGRSWAAKFACGAGGLGLFYLPMPSAIPSEEEPQPIDARARIRNSEKSSRWFAIVFWTIGLAGLGGCYWYYANVYVPEERAQAHLAETQAYARELRAAVAELGQWSTQASFDSVRAELVAFDEREDAQLAVRSQLWDLFSKAYEPRAQRLREFEALRRELEDLSLDADEERFMAIQERVREASGRFERPLMEQLKGLWAPRREAIAERLGLSGSSGTGAIEVRSVPSGARLFLNDRMVGVTPLQASGIRAGSLTLVLKHPQYHDFVYPIEIKEFGVLTLTDLEMKPREGAVEITVVGGATSDRVEVELICANEDGETFDYVKTFSGVYVSVPALIIGGYDVTVYVNGRPRQSTKLVVIEGDLARWTARL